MLGRSKLPIQTLFKAALTGYRWPGKEAQKAGMVDLAVPQEKLILAACKLAGQVKEQSKNPLYAVLKKRTQSRSLHRVTISNSKAPEEEKREAVIFDVHPSDFKKQHHHFLCFEQRGKLKPCQGGNDAFINGILLAFFQLRK